jgi:hypothetical protein
VTRSFCIDSPLPVCTGIHCTPMTCSIAASGSLHPPLHCIHVTYSTGCRVPGTSTACRAEAAAGSSQTASGGAKSSARATCGRAVEISRCTMRMRGGLSGRIGGKGERVGVAHQGFHWRVLLGEAAGDSRRGWGWRTYVVDLNDCVIVVLGQYQCTVHGLVHEGPGKGECVMRGCFVPRRKAAKLQDTHSIMWHASLVASLLILVSSEIQFPCASASMASANISYMNRHRRPTATAARPRLVCWPQSVVFDGPIRSITGSIRTHQCTPSTA